MVAQHSFGAGRTLALALAAGNVYLIWKFAIKQRAAPWTLLEDRDDAGLKTIWHVFAPEMYSNDSSEMSTGTLELAAGASKLEPRREAKAPSPEVAVEDFEVREGEPQGEEASNPPMEAAAEAGERAAETSFAEQDPQHQGKEPLAQGTEGSGTVPALSKAAEPAVLKPTELAPEDDFNVTSCFKLKRGDSFTVVKGEKHVDIRSHVPNAATCAALTTLRIQKTGSTSLEEHIMPAMCKLHKQWCTKIGHMEFRCLLQIAADIDACTYTMLRDPVDRFMSEFLMLLSDKRVKGVPKRFTMPTWDFSEADRASLTNATSNLKYMLDYLHHSGNPGRNRQALYVLGFKRLWEGGYPAQQYDWDKKGPELLAKAKSHLMSFTDFGLVECFSASIYALGEKMGWSEKQLKKKLSSSDAHSRSQSAQMEKISKSHFGNRKSGKFWRDVLSSQVVKEILRASHVDDELVSFARQQFYERHGKHCGS